MIYEVLDIEPRQRDVADAVELKAGPGEIRFEDIYFSYNETAPVLHGVSFVARAGETTAVVGASGAGKSTLITLSSASTISTAARSCSMGRTLRTSGSSRCAMPSPMSRSSLICSKAPLPTTSAMAARTRRMRKSSRQPKLAHAHEFILQQPQGYDTPVGENGVTLSGGQRQRVSIARAIVRNAPVLLLDEATSALDNESEKRVQQALEGIMQNRTTVVIAHRLSTVVNADRIVVMEAGRVVEEGRHDDLIAIPNGVYARFYQLQSGNGDFITGKTTEELRTGEPR